MARESKKHEAPAGEAVKEKSLAQLILDKTHGKYTVVSITSHWALELRRQEENRHLSQAEILDMAMRDILSGKVSPERVEKAIAAAAAVSRAADGKDKK